MFRTMCVDLSSNLMAISGCHNKKKRKRLYNPDADDIYLKRFANTIVSPDKNISFNDNSNTHLENSNNCERISKTTGWDLFGDSASNVEREIKKHKYSKKKKKKEHISTEENSFDEISNCQSDVQKPEDILKKSLSNVDKTRILIEENDANVKRIKEKNCPKSIWDGKQAGEKGRKLKKSKDNVIVCADKNNVEMLNETNSFKMSFSNVQKSKDNLREIKNSVNAESDFAEKYSAVDENQPQSVVESLFNQQPTKKNHKKSSKNKDKEPFFPHDNNNAEESTKEISCESFSKTLKDKKKHKKSKKNKAEDPNFTKVQNIELNGEIQAFDKLCCTKNKKHKKFKKNENKASETADINNVIKIVNEQNQYVHSFYGVNERKKKHKSEKNKDKEPTLILKNNTVDIEKQSKNLLEENQSSGTFYNVQKDEKKHKKSKKNKDREPETTDVNNVVKITNEQNQSVYSFCGAKKHKKSKKNKKDKELMKEKNIVEIGNDFSSLPFEENQSVDMFGEVQQKKKKHKLKKYEDGVENTTDENNVKMPSEQNQNIDSFHGDEQKKKKHKKSKKNKNKELMEEGNKVEIGTHFQNLPFEENQYVDTFSDVQHTKKKSKKAKKNEEQNITDENNVLEITTENQLVDPLYDKQLVKKKHKKSEINMNKHKITESRIDMPDVNSVSDNSFYDLKQPKKKHKKSKSHKNKESIFSIKNFVLDAPNKDKDLVCDVRLKKRHKRHESNLNEEPTLLEENNIFNVPSQIGKDNLLEGSSLGAQMMKNIHKIERTNVKAIECLSHPNMIARLKKISQTLDVDNLSNEGSQNSNNNNENVHSIEDLSNDDDQNFNSNKNVHSIEDLSNDDDQNFNSNENVHSINESSTNDSQNCNKNENIHSRDESLEETESLNLDFCDESLDFDIPPLHAFETVRPLSKSQKKEMLYQGVTIKTGRFTRSEDETLLKNFENLSHIYDTLDVYDIFGIGTETSDHRIQRYLKANHFYVRLGRGLNDRTLSSIYKRARLLLHPHRNNGKLSQTEVKTLKNLRKVSKKKWVDLGKYFEQPADKCLQTFRWHEKPISKGKWTAKEEKKLIEAIKKVTKSSDLSCDKVKNISWDEIASFVPSRNSTQCRMHWAHHLGWKSEAERGKWDKSCNRKLVEILRRDWYVEDATKIDWFKVHQSFENVSPSPTHVQKRWLYLKTKIDDFKKKDYKTILNELCNLYSVSPNETFCAPFSSSAINQRLSRSITNMRKCLENR